MKSRTILILVVWMVALPAIADDGIVRIRQRTVGINVVGIRVEHGSSWSGTVIGHVPDGRYAVLTCAHGYERQQPAEVEMQSQRWIVGEIIALDRGSDVGLIAVRHDTDIPTHPVASAAPVSNATVTVAGYPFGQSIMASRNTRILDSRGSRVRTDAPFSMGESGGPLLVNGEVVGVIVGTNFVDGFAVPWHLVNQVASQYVATDRPTLYVFSDRGCAACTAFKRDLAARGKFGDTLRKEFAVTFVSTTTHQALAAKYKVDRIPTFAPANGDGKTFVGYRSEDQEKVLVDLKPYMLTSNRSKPYRSGSQPAPGPRINIDIGGETEPGLGEPGPVPAPSPVVVEQDEAPPIDWSHVEVIIAVRRKDAVGGVKGKILSAIERLAEGPVRRAIVDRLNGKADVQVVFERLRPNRYAAIRDAAGLGDAEVAAIVLVKKQFSGLRGMIVSQIEKALLNVKESRFREIPVEVIFERRSPDDFAAVQEALGQSESESTVDGGEAGSSDSGPAGLLWEWITAGLAVGGGWKGFVEYLRLRVRARIGQLKGAVS